MFVPVIVSWKLDFNFSNSSALSQGDKVTTRTEILVFVIANFVTPFVAKITEYAEWLGKN